MKRINKIIAVILAAIALFSIAVPTMAFAEDAAEETTVREYDPTDQYDFENPLPEHPTIDDVWAYITGGSGNTADIDWKKLPEAFLHIFAMIRFVEIFLNFFRGLFGGNA